MNIRLMCFFLIVSVVTIFSKCKSIIYNNPLYENSVQYTIVDINTDSIYHYNMMRFITNDKVEGTLLLLKGDTLVREEGMTYENKLCKVHTFMFEDSINLRSGRSDLNQVYLDGNLIIDLSRDAKNKIYKICN